MKSYLFKLLYLKNEPILFQLGKHLLFKVKVLK